MVSCVEPGAGRERPDRRTVFELTTEVEYLLSRAHIPLLSQLVQTFANSLPAEQVASLLRQSGRALGEELMAGRRPSGSLRARVELASQLLNEQLGALTQVEKNGGFVIRGVGCPLSALSGKHHGACLAMESLVSELVGAPTHECCVREGRPRCCFTISNGAV
jgi:predicted ArsR family transcriptional regulator